MREGFGAEGVYEVFSGKAEDTRGGYEITRIVGTEVSMKGVNGIIGRGGTRTVHRREQLKDFRRPELNHVT